MPCCVTAVCLWESQSWMNLLFSVSQDSIVDCNLQILIACSRFSIWIKSRIDTRCTDCKLTFEQNREIPALKTLPILLINFIRFPVFVLNDAPTLMRCPRTSGVSSNKPSTCPEAVAPPEGIYTHQGFWYYAMCSFAQLILSFYWLHNP